MRGTRANLDVAKLEGLVRLELGERGGAARVVVTIVDADRAEVTLARLGADRPPEEPRRGVVELRGAADVERTIALFVGELARTAEPPPAAPAPATTPAPATPAPTAEAAQPTPPADSASSRLRATVLASFGARWTASGGAIVLTPHLEGGVVVRDALRLGAIARYGSASADDPIGSVSAHSGSGGLAATLRLASSGGLALWTGPRAEIGVVAARGDGPGASSASSLVLSAAWAIEARAALGPIDGVLALEGGWLGRGLELRADDRTVLELSGGFAGASLGVGLP